MRSYVSIELTIAKNEILRNRHPWREKERDGPGDSALSRPAAHDDVYSHPKAQAFDDDNHGE